MPFVKTGQDHVVFVVYGVPYRIPIGWVKSEAKEVANDITLHSNPDVAPSLTMNRVNYLVTIHVPCLGGEHLAKAKLLKAYLDSICSALAGQRHEEQSQETIASDIAATKLSGGVVIHQLVLPEMPGVLQMMCGYYGESVHMVSGYIQSFHTTFDPSTKIDVWNITFAAQPLVNVRRKGPAKPPQGVSAGTGAAGS